MKLYHHQMTRWITLAAVLLTTSLWAQELVLPDEMLNTNIKDWQLNGVTLLLAVQVLGRAFSGLSKGGGIVGAVKGVLFGTNTPKT